MKAIIERIALIAGFTAGALWGDLTPLFWSLVVLAVIDYVTGVLRAYTKRELDSRKGWTGIVRKIVIFGVLIVAHQIDLVITGANGALMGACELFFVANEGLSIVENAAGIGVPIPKRLLNALEQIKEKNDGEDGKDKGDGSH